MAPLYSSAGQYLAFQHWGALVGQCSATIIAGPLGRRGGVPAVQGAHADHTQARDGQGHAVSLDPLLLVCTEYSLQ